MSDIRRCPFCLQYGSVTEAFSLDQLVHCPGCGAEVAVSELVAPEGDAGVADVVGDFEPVAFLETPGETPAGVESTAPPSAEAAGVEIAQVVGMDEVTGVGKAQAFGDLIGEEGLGATTAEQKGHINEQVADDSFSPVASTRAEVVSEYGDEGSVDMVTVAEAALREGPAAEGPEVAVEPEPVTLICPTCGGNFDLRECRLAATGETLPPGVVDAVRASLSGGGSAFGAVGAPPVWVTAETGSRGGIQIVVPEGEARRRPFARQPVDKKRLIKDLVGWVVGGVLGLVIAYYLIVIIRGDHGNFLRVPLPGIKSSYKYSPDWFPSFMKTDSSSPAAEGGNSEGKNPKKERQGKAVQHSD